MSVYMNFDDVGFDNPSRYKFEYGVCHPYMVGIVLDAVFPIKFQSGVYQLKIAVFQSNKSFGYFEILAKELKDLPKIHSRGQIIHCKGIQQNGGL